MCFSATASFVAAGALGAAGTVTVRDAKTKDRLPFAALPWLFAAQQAVEGVIWLSFARFAWLQLAASYVYVTFSHVLWPTYVPYAVMRLEPAGRRRSVLKGFVVFGVSLSAWLASYVFRGPILSHPSAQGIIYQMYLPEIPHGLAAYVFVTCVSCFVSSHKFVRVFGMALVGALAISLWSYREAFYSVWCFFAAILSLIVYAHLNEGRRLWPRMVKMPAV